MEHSTNKISRSQSAVIAAISLLIMAIIAPIANFNLIGKMLVSADAAKTLLNISSSPGAFRTSIVLFLLVAILDVVVSWALYIFFKPVNNRIFNIIEY